MSGRTEISPKIQYTTEFAKSRPFDLIRQPLRPAMAKPPSSAAAAAAGGRGSAHHRTRLLLLLLVAVAASASTAGFLLRGALSDPCDARGNSAASAAGSPLEFMSSKLVLLVSHELSLSGNLLTEWFTP
jgi:hypothetical protein